MGYYPINLRLDGRPCIVIGGGAIAEQKVATLLAAQGRVTVVAPELTPGLAALAKAGSIVHYPRPYQAGDLSGVFLAVAATDRIDVQRAAAAEAEAEGVLLNVVDTPELCTFIVPAVARQGPLTVAVSTGGASPALARRVRDEIAQWLGPEHSLFVRILERLRQRLAAGAGRQRLFGDLVHSPVLDWLRQGRLADVDRLLGGLAGEGCTLTDLGITDAEAAEARAKGADGP